MDVRCTFKSMQLTRERIVGTAIELIEREGVDAVSMRRIAAELGSGVMSLYNHVPSKDALLDAVAEQVMSGIDFSTDPEASWQDQVRHQARAFRQIARAHPRCTLVVVSRHNASPTGLRPIEHALATLRSAGFGGEEAVRIVRAFVAYIVGSLLREVTGAPSVAQPVPADQDETPGAGPHRLDPDEFPQVTSLAAELMHKDHDADFEFGLDLLVRAVAEQRPAGVH